MTCDPTPYLEQLLRTFSPEVAGDWAVSFHFVADGGPGATLTIGDGACRLATGRPEGPVVEVRMAPGACPRLVGRPVSLKNAFVRGDLMTSASLDLLRLDECLAEASPPGPVHLDRQLVGRVLEDEPTTVEADRIVAFADAIGDDHPRYRGQGRPAMPIVFPITLVRSIFIRLLTEEETGGDVTQMVHAEQDIRIHRPLVAGDVVRPSARIASIDEVAVGESLTIEQSLLVEEKLAVDISTVLFFRDAGGRRRRLGKGLHTRPRVSKRTPDILFERTIGVEHDMPVRYAAASGDLNPIHTDPDFARAMGFRDLLLQGTCTMALASRTLVDEAAGGDPDRIRRFHVRFARPVFPGDLLTTAGWIENEFDGRTGYGFETSNQERKRVLINGLAEVE